MFRVGVGFQVAADFIAIHVRPHNVKQDESGSGQTFAGSGALRRWSSSWGGAYILLFSHEATSD